MRQLLSFLGISYLFVCEVRFVFFLLWSQIQSLLIWEAEKSTKLQTSEGVYIYESAGEVNMHIWSAGVYIYEIYLFSPYILC